MSLSRLSICIGLFVSGIAFLAPRSIHAQESDPCLAAPVDGQVLRKAGKLLEAHEKFAVCAARICPAEIVQQCARWVHEVEEATPSVVVAAKDAGGRDLVDARVSIDDRPATEVSARAIPLNAGSHSFVFRRDGSPDVRVSALLREGEKNREVVATFAVPQSTSGTGAEARPIPAGVWIAGAIGVVGLVTSGVFGALGVDERAGDHCDSLCSQADADSVTTKLRVADVALGVGVVSLAVATVLYLTRGSAVAEPPPSAAVQVGPGSQGASVALHF